MSLKERFRGNAMETLWQDIRYGVRMVGNHPGFTVIVVVILAVGIGANTAIFSVVNAVMLRPLPYKDSHHIVTIEERGIRWEERFMHRPNFFFLREHNQVFESLAGYCGRMSYVTGIEKPHEIRSCDVTWNLFSLLGVQPMLGPRRFAMILLGLFAGIALILATVGIYGLLQYSTTQQTHDIGIRMALGACKIDVLRVVLKRGLILTLTGVILGLAGAFALTWVLSSLLYDVTATDPATLAGVSLLLAGIALLASYIPARRAAGIDPVIALRYE